MPAPSASLKLSEDFPGRGAGTDAERRAAGELAGRVGGPRRETRIETFWCRPSWALAHAWHCLAGATGSLVAVSHPLPGAIVLAVVLLSVLSDAATGFSFGRRLTPERASQNVVAEPRSPQDARLRLLVTANLDAGRTGLARRPAVAALGARVRRLPGGRVVPGPLGWLALALVWLLVIAVLRERGVGGTILGVLQLAPTAGLVLGLALLIDIALAPWSPGAGDNASGTAVAVALVRALDAAPPPHLRVELCLQGAGDGQMIGLRHHLRARRRELGRATTVVLGIAPAAAGEPVWLQSDGPLVALGFHRRLRELAARAAAPSEPGADPLARPSRGRGTSPALPARLRARPALTIGCLDRAGLVPRAHSASDTTDQLDPGAVDRLLEFALTLVDALDADLAQRTDAAGPRDAARTAA